MKRAREREADAANRLPEQSRELIRTLMRAVCDTPLYRSSRKLNGQRGAALLAKMRTGAQTLTDFEDEHALWGYVNAVGSKRAFNVCDTFGWLWTQRGPIPWRLTQMFARRPHRQLRVASLGGGPASCLLGWAIFERLVISGRDCDADASADAPAATPAAAHAASASPAAAGSSAMPPPRLHVFDYAPSWAPLVQRVADALGEPIGFGGCELTHGLDHPANCTLHTVSSTGLDLVLLVYVLHECDHDRPGLDASGRPPHWAVLRLDYNLPTTNLLPTTSLLPTKIDPCH